MLDTRFDSFTFAHHTLMHGSYSTTSVPGFHSDILLLVYSVDLSNSMHTIVMLQQCTKKRSDGCAGGKDSMQ